MAGCLDQLSQGVLRWEELGDNVLTNNGHWPDEIDVSLVEVAPRLDRELVGNQEVFIRAHETHIGGCLPPSIGGLHRVVPLEDLQAMTSAAPDMSSI